MTRTRAVAASLAAALVLAGCGQDDPEPAAAASSDQPAAADRDEAIPNPDGSGGILDVEPSDPPEGAIDPDDDHATITPVEPDPYEQHTGAAARGVSDLCDTMADIEMLVEQDPDGDYAAWFTYISGLYSDVATTDAHADTIATAEYLSGAFGDLGDELAGADIDVTDEDQVEAWLMSTDKFDRIDGLFAEHGMWALPDPNGEIEACFTWDNVPG